MRKPGRLPRRRPQAERKKLGMCQLEETALFNKHFTDAITFLLFDLEIAISSSEGGRKSLEEFPGPRSAGAMSLHGIESLGHRHGGSHSRWPCKDTFSPSPWTLDPFPGWKRLCVLLGASDIRL